MNLLLNYTIAMTAQSMCNGRKSLTKYRYLEMFL